MNLPIMIQYLFMAYYWIQEKFTIHEDEIEINESGTIAGRIRTETGFQTVYGNNVININDESVTI